MSMRIVILGLLAACFAVGVTAAESTRQRSDLLLSDCLDPSRARAWHLIDHDEILVDAGRRHFHLKLDFSCPELTYNHTIEFRAGSGIGRVCGHRGDAIITPRPSLLGRNCRIGVVTPLDRAQYDRYLDRKAQTEPMVRPAERAATSEPRPPKGTVTVRPN